MKKSLLALAAMAAAGISVRARTHDVAFGYRMGAGFAGDVNRTHPASIFPGMLDQTAGNTPRSYGTAVVANAANNTLRQIVAADQSDVNPITIMGALVRPFPVQAGSSAGAFGQQALGDATAPVSTVANDYLADGRMMVMVRGANPGALNINSAVYVFCTADEAGHVQGGFETAAIAGKTVKVANARYRGPADSNGIAEIEIMHAA